MERLRPLTELALILILASHSKGETWGLKVDRRITAEKGKSVIVPCTFSYPPEHHADDLQLFWKLPKRSAFNTYDNDQNAFFYHPNHTFVVKKYQGKTTMSGNGNDRNCTLGISSLLDDQLVIYFRIVGKEKYSFWDQRVTISARGQDAATVLVHPDAILPTTPTPVDPQNLMNRKRLQTIYTAVFVPLAAVVILLAAGLLVWKKHARSQSLMREGSGYYANFSRGLPKQATRKENEQDNKSLPAGKVVEEPIYINVQAASQMGADMARGERHKENIYENVVHAK
ncbi:sialoadhesin-like isoform X2 [Syngnathoides biaculeatus]|uniref:sialoadhesin-like isoform X2 n=1 Tax=Syngnathoides biaculeatus TaxID=300417 RepID=UPI002ADDEA11|nr:sialoadhesin-like isoform X2 [Syngnathoides biaculeatus]